MTAAERGAAVHRRACVHPTANELCRVVGGPIVASLPMRGGPGRQREHNCIVRQCLRTSATLVISHALCPDRDLMRRTARVARTIALLSAFACTVPDGPTSSVPTIPYRAAVGSVQASPDSARQASLSDAIDLASDPLLTRIVAALSDQTRPQITFALAAIRTDLARQDVASAVATLSQLHHGGGESAIPADVPLLSVLDAYITGIEQTISLQQREK